jgi:dihydroorotase-like cyclic amidohydrolase
MDAARPLKIENVVVDGEPATIHCDAGLIASIERRGGEGATGAPGPIPEVLDGRGCLAHAPLINAHTPCRDDPLPGKRR